MVGRPHRGRRGREFRAGTEQFGQEVGRELLRVGVVEDEGRRKLQAGGSGKEVAQLHRGQRVETEVLERLLRGDLRGGGVRQDPGDLAAYQVQQDGDLLGPAEFGQLGAQGRADRVIGGGGGGLLVQDAGDFGDVLDERASAGHGVARGETLPVHVRDGQSGLVLFDGLAQRLDGQGRVHRPDAAPRQLLGGAVGGHAGGLPAAPGDGGRGQTAGPALAGQTVQVGVGGGVPAVAGAAPDGGTGGEQDERVQVDAEFGGQGVQVPRTEGLGGHLGFQIGEFAVRPTVRRSRPLLRCGRRR
ncbi:hypothetical protein SAVIM40S_08130 [Streptomyces avidinii]